MVKSQEKDDMLKLEDLLKNKIFPSTMGMIKKIEFWGFIKKLDLGLYFIRSNEWIFNLI